MVYTHSNSNTTHTTHTMFAMHSNNEDQKNQNLQMSQHDSIDGAAEWDKVLQGFNPPTSPKKRSREDLEREIQELRMQLQPKKKQRRLPPMPVLKDFIADTQNFKQQLDEWNQKKQIAKNNKTQGQKADKTIRSAALRIQTFFQRTIVTKQRFRAFEAFGTLINGAKNQRAIKDVIQELNLPEDVQLKLRNMQQAHANVCRLRAQMEHEANQFYQHYVDFSNTAAKHVH